MNKTKQEKWQRAYGDTPDSFRQRVAASLPKGEESRHVAFPRRAMVLAAALVLVLTDGVCSGRHAHGTGLERGASHRERSG